MNMKYTLAWGWINFKNFDLKIEKLLGERGGDFFRWRGGCHEKQYSGGGGVPKKGGLEQFANLRGLGKKVGWCFWGGVDIPMHTMKPLSLRENYYQRNCLLLI